MTNYRESIELFHLLFCARMAAKVDRELFCLKGGCNLRFYFNSIRYSEDIDFDVHTLSVGTLRKNIEKLLAEKTFLDQLNHRGIEIVDWSAPKQTETTQRWKLSLQVTGHSLPIPTKIEFSRRTKAFAGAEIKFIPPMLISHYKLQPALLQHYTLDTAIQQKLNALIHRTETQARDVIDLKLLKDQLLNNAGITLSADMKVRALETLSAVSYDDFKSQVWPYLLEEFQAPLERRDQWDELQDEVFTFIETLPETTT